MLKTSSSTDSLTNAAQIVVEYDGVDDGIVIPTGSSLLKMFIWFANFYQRIIQKGKIAALLTSMLKTSGSTKSTIRLGKGGVGVGGDDGDNGSHDNEYTSRLRRSTSTDLSTNTAQVRVKYDEADDVRWCWWQVGRKVIKKSKKY